MLYIRLFAFGLCCSLFTYSGLASAVICNIQDPFTTDTISAYYATEIGGRGCTTNTTNSKSQEVHAINLLNVGPVFRNDVGQVNLFIKSRKGDVLWKPVIFVLNSQQPVRWRVRMDIFSPKSKKHIFVIPRHSTVKLIKKKRRRQIRKTDAIPSDSQELINWIQQKYGAVTSFTEVKRGNRMTLQVGVEKDNPPECELQDSPGSLNTVAKYEQPQFMSGCFSAQAKNPITRLAYIIELDRAHIKPNTNMDVEVELDIRSSLRKNAETNFILVLKSPKDVAWKVKTVKLDGYIDVVATGFVEIKEIRMDTVGVRTEDITVTGQALIQWVSDFIGDVGMYAHVSLANKIKLVLPDTAPSSSKPPGGATKQSETVTLMNPFQNPSRTKTILRSALHAQCSPNGNLVVALRKSVIKKYFGLKRSQITLVHSDCVAQENKTDLYIQSNTRMCGTQAKRLHERIIYTNSLVIHPSSIDDALSEVGSGSGADDQSDTTDDMIDGSGAGSPTPPIMYIDDEDYKATGNIVIEFDCVTSVSEITTPVSMATNHNQTYFPDIGFQMELYESRFFVDPNYHFPMSVAAGAKVYAKASLNADNSLGVIVRSCWLSPSVDQRNEEQTDLIKDGCIKHPSVKWDLPPQFFPTQSKKFSFQAINSYPYSFLKCQLQACRQWDNPNDPKYNHLPQCQTQAEVCKGGTPSDDPQIPRQVIVRGPIYAKESSVTSSGEENHKPEDKDQASHINVRTQAPPEKEKSQGHSSRTSNQTIIVEGLDSGTVVGIAFAAFIIGVLLMAALWFIHRQTGPIKHAVVARSGLDGSGETTPMSTAPLQINS